MQVFDVKFNLSQIGLNVEVIHQMVSGLVSTNFDLCYCND